MKTAADRVLSLLLLGLAAFVAVQAWQLQVPFSYDPVGPKTFPLVLSGVLALLALILMFRPGEGNKWPSGIILLKLISVLVGLALYAFLFSRLGFIVSSILVVILLARMFGATWAKSFIAGVLMAVGGFFLFTYGLDISLPAGSWLPDLF